MLGHPRSAFDWMRTYWGGMLAEGATSFWGHTTCAGPRTHRTSCARFRRMNRHSNFEKAWSLIPPSQTLSLFRSSLRDCSTNCARAAPLEVTRRQAPFASSSRSKSQLWMQRLQAKYSRAW
jgi:hypothetical protein